MTTPMVVGFAGSSNTANGTTGYRPLIQAGLISNYPVYLFSFLNISANGWATWPNLVNQVDLAAADLIIFDQSNDGENDTAHVEALIRKAAAANQRVIGIVNPAWLATTDDQINTPVNKTALEQHITVLQAYGVPYVDGWQLCKDHVAGGGHLSDHFADTAHWSANGYAAVTAVILDYLPTGGMIASPLPGRIYAESEDFQQAPVIMNGTDYVSKTGAWTEDGTKISSSEAGATITFSGAFRSFGCYRASGSYPNVTVKIDDDDPIENFAFYANGYDIGTRGEHTIVITVTTTVQIDEFWAI